MIFRAPLAALSTPRPGTVSLMLSLRSTVAATAKRSTRWRPSSSAVSRLRNWTSTLHDGDAFVVEDHVEGGRVPGVAVADQVLHGGAGVLEVHDQVPGQLFGPGRVGMG